MPTVVALAAVATLAWAWTGAPDATHRPGAEPAPPGRPAAHTPGPAVGETGVAGPPAVSPPPPSAAPVASAQPAAPAGASDGPGAGPVAGSVPPSAGPVVRPAGRRAGPCRTGADLVPTCGVLWGVAPGAFTDERGTRALADFERDTERHQDIYHAYHGGQRQLFPTDREISIARQSGKERILLLNWKPAGVSWARIARGDRNTDAFLDRLAAHINRAFPEPFFLAIHHEAENEVRERPGSGYEAEDYAAMFRHVVQRLRARGADNVVTVLIHMAYVPHTSQSWFARMYPGDAFVDWIGFDTYAYSDPGYGHGDFAELLNRRSALKPDWPGFYNWAHAEHPGKPLMVAEWGVWFSRRNPDHAAEFYREVGRQIHQFPNIRALVHFDTPHSQRGRSSSVDATQESLTAYRRLGHLPIFNVDVRPLLP